MRTQKILIYFSNFKVTEELKKEIEETINSPILNEEELIPPLFSKTASGVYEIKNLKTFERIKKYNILKLLILLPNTDLNKVLSESFSPKVDVLLFKHNSQIPLLIKKYIDNFNKYLNEITFMKICEAYELKGSCLSRSVGVVIVKKNKIISAAENNSMISCLKRECKFCIKKSKNIKDCFCIHAETNALNDITIPIDKDTTLYSTTFPCTSCSLQIIKSGIKRVVFRDFYKSDSFDKSIQLFKENSISCLQLKKLNNVPCFDLITILK